jgi:hypothetical protein
MTAETVSHKERPTTGLRRLAVFAVAAGWLVVGLLADRGPWGGALVAVLLAAIGAISASMVVTTGPPLLDLVQHAAWALAAAIAMYDGAIIWFGGEPFADWSPGRASLPLAAFMTAAGARDWLRLRRQT